MEAGIFNYGSDMTLTNNPYEITGLERLVEPQEAGYIGKRTLEAIAAQGVARKLVGIEYPQMREALSLAEFWPAYSGRERVGHVTATTWSPRLQKNIGYVWVPVALARPGITLEVESPLGRIPGVTASLPFVDPGKRISKS